MKSKKKSETKPEIKALAKFIQDTAMRAAEQLKSGPVVKTESESELADDISEFLNSRG